MYAYIVQLKGENKKFLKKNGIYEKSLDIKGF